MRRNVVPQTQLITRVNVTPIIDVALVLVIILLVTAPMLSVADLPVDLPQARTREAENQRNVSVTLGANGQLAVDDEVIPPDSLRDKLSLRLAEPGNKDVLVVIRADSGAPYVAVRTLLTQARAAGAKRLAIATRQKVQAGQ
jgi:biopolymer transport protein TolR